MNTPASFTVADDQLSGLPSLEEANGRLDAARGRPQPWLSPAAFDAAKDLADRGVPELSGPVGGEIPD